MTHLKSLLSRCQEERLKEESEHRAALERLLAEAEERLGAAQDLHCAQLLAKGHAVETLEERLTKAERDLARVKEEHSCLDEEQGHMSRRERGVIGEIEQLKSRIEELQAKMASNREVCIVSLLHRNVLYGYY